MPNKQLETKQYQDFKFIYTVDKVRTALDNLIKYKRKDFLEWEITELSCIEHILQEVEELDKSHISICSKQAQLLKLWSPPVKSRKGKGETSKTNIKLGKR